MTKLILIAHNIRSTHNIGSIFRSAECFGVDKIILTGYSPYPKVDNDTRLPHLAEKIHQQIHKTALGTETKVTFSYSEVPPIASLKEKGFVITALEQHVNSIPLRDYSPPEKMVLLLGEERYGITTDLLNMCDQILEIPMTGTKESLNVSVATGIALYDIMQR
jgi:tRNA G18 (ribose-2'-O)-methylase SpoU